MGSQSPPGRGVQCESRLGKAQRTGEKQSFQAASIKRGVGVEKLSLRLAKKCTFGIVFSAVSPMMFKVSLEEGRAFFQIPRCVIKMLKSFQTPWEIQ